mmetsp:Transcript_2673/g.3092  ORF Transcript_2673/g.3092 Transcript_2673/m.3092 type:complete len:83 (+) Transcript_2673:197-445(+)
MSGKVDIIVGCQPPTSERYSNTQMLWTQTGGPHAEAYKHHNKSQNNIADTKFTLDQVGKRIAQYEHKDWGCGGDDELQVMEW